MSVKENYSNILHAIKAVAQSINRDPSQISIISVSKTFPAHVMQEAIDSGMHIFGENKIQEAAQKIQLLHGNFSLHMIGHLQSNKSKEAVKIFDLIHSIDKESTAIKVNHEAALISKVQNILIQINASGETSKSGLAPHQAIPFIKNIIDLPNIKILGLMTMAPYTDNAAIIRNTFKTTRLTLEDINSYFGVDFKELSMGMSSDYPIAIEEGSTMVRIGSAIFGGRI